jgi:hypothetical protein
MENQLCSYAMQPVLCLLTLLAWLAGCMLLVHGISHCCSFSEELFLSERDGMEAAALSMPAALQQPSCLCCTWWLCCLLMHALLCAALCCRERGAKALQERLEMKKIADAPVVESATAAAASGLPHTGSGSQLA